MLMTMPPIPPPGGPPLSPSNDMPPPPCFGLVPTPSRKPWILIGVSLSVVVALVVGLLVWQGTSSGSGSGTGDPSPIADDIDRTVGFLREEDPVCDDWHSAANELNARAGVWSEIDDLTPASRWTPEQKRIYADVGEAMTASSDRFEAILPKARNVTIQELIAQVVVYLRKYVRALPEYVESDRRYASIAMNFVNAVTYSCSSVPLVEDMGDHEILLSTVARPALLEEFMPSPDQICAEYVSVVELQNTVLSGWAETDATVAAAQWTEKERALNNAAREVLLTDSTRIREIARNAEGRVVGDLIALQSTYMRAFADAIPTYVPDDVWLWRVSTGIGGGLGAACGANP
jgi:hypothetical protein